MNKNPRNVAADVIDQYLKRYPVGTKVRWGRRKKAPDIKPDGVVMSMTWQEVKANGGGFELLIRWPVPQCGTNISHRYGTHIEYTKYMFDKYVTYIKPDHALKKKAKTTFHLSRDLHIQEKSGGWTQFGSSLPYAVRMLRWTETSQWLMMMMSINRPQSFSDNIAPFDPPPAVPLFQTYTRPPLTVDMSKLDVSDLCDVLISPLNLSETLDFPEDYDWSQLQNIDWN